MGCRPPGLESLLTAFAFLPMAGRRDFRMAMDEDPTAPGPWKLGIACVRAKSARQSPVELYRLLNKNSRGIPADFDFLSLMKPTAEPGLPRFCLSGTMGKRSTSGRRISGTRYRMVTIWNTAHQLLRQGLPFTALLRQSIRVLRHNSTLEDIRPKHFLPSSVAESLLTDFERTPLEFAHYVFFIVGRFRILTEIFITHRSPCSELVS
jgi:hypothetical protein